MLREKIDRTVAAYEEEKAKLYRTDGTKRYSEEEHAEREADLNRRFRAAMDAIEEEIGRNVERAEEALLVAEDSDPTDILTTDELELANARRSFVSDEVWRLSMDALQRRLRAVLAEDNKVSAFLYVLYASQRVGEADEDADEEGAYEDRELVEELRAKMDPDGEKRRERARRALEEAHGDKDYAYLRRRGARDIAELYAMQSGYNRPGSLG